MHRIAKFHFVSPAQFMTAMQEEYPQYTEAPDMISLPRLLLN